MKTLVAVFIFAALASLVAGVWLIAGLGFALVAAAPCWLALALVLVRGALTADFPIAAQANFGDHEARP